MQGIALIAVAAALMLYAVGGCITVADLWRGWRRPRGSAEWLAAAIATTIITLFWPRFARTRLPERDDG